jgi:histidinol-phosphatase (PHP family)
MIEAALSFGITDFGLSAHSRAPFDPAYSVKDERAYIQEVRALKAAYAGRLNVYVGTEVDLLAPPAYPDAYEYTVASTHYVEKNETIYSIDGPVESLVRCLDEGFNGDPAALSAAYFQNVIACVRTGADILGHFDLIKKRAAGRIDFSADYYVEPALDALRFAAKSGIVIEVNYGGVLKAGLDQPYPGLPLLAELKRLGGRVTVSTDCHDAAFIGFGLREGRRLLKDLGFARVCQFADGRFIDVPL